MSGSLTTQTVLTTRQTISPLFRREKRKEWVLFSALILLAAIILMMFAVIIEQSETLRQQEEGLYRTNDDLVNGGKRFIDYFYSLDSATVQYDQFRALQMIIDPALVEERMQYLKMTDFVRKVKNAGMNSEIDWNRTSSEIISEEDETLKVEYRGYLRIDNKRATSFNILLLLKPVKKNDFNTDGVGILRWIDVAEKPFKEGVTDEN